ncbi:hypothetical protein [Pseudonocardia broussonetiae]|uniref:Helix-turn-helix domain-containing protein n=1 Tax=Pseudonocardia broussonetiae TaxID=2736640 RepID=A0A6M6JXI7_9PSEU|nr:hypothetical protein [Pseudonocardia broussonetiae]QJY51232.1 hypothetical protein HOP40_35210 [Pseudonocardia broussonetiae]
MAQRPDPAERRAVRRLVLAGMLQSIRARNGWSVNDAASRASIAPMTWRRLEDGLDVRRRSLTAVDGLLEQPFGTVSRALNDDLVMVELLRLDRDDVDAVAPETSASYLDALAERQRSGSTGGVHHYRSVTDHIGVTGSAASAVANLGALRAQAGGGTVARAAAELGALQAGTPSVENLLAGLAAFSTPNPGPVSQAAMLVDLITRRPMTPALENAVAAILAAMPDLVTDRLQDAARAVDVLALSENESLHEAAAEVARLATDRAVEATKAAREARE